MALFASALASFFLLSGGMLEWIDDMGGRPTSGLWGHPVQFFPEIDRAGKKGGALAPEPLTFALAVNFGKKLNGQSGLGSSCLEMAKRT